MKRNEKKPEREGGGMITKRDGRNMEVCYRTRLIFEAAVYDFKECTMLKERMKGKGNSRKAFRVNC